MIASTPLIATVAANAAAAPASNAPNGSDDANGFAHHLEQAHQSGPAPTNTAPTTTADGAPSRPAPKAARKAAEIHADKGDGSARTADAAKADDTAAPADLASLLAGLMAPAAAHSAPAAGVNSPAQGPATAALAATGSGRGSPLAAQDGAKDKPRAGLGKDGGARAGEGKPATDALPQDTKPQPEGAPAPARPEALAALQAPPSHAAQAVADSAARSIGAPVQAQVAAPLGSPEFAPALGAQVSVLVRDGVQEARLQLNPAEMGPITVQIQLDGSNAQVNMAAEHHQTRQALEQAMPSLAGALRENGLTLTGGGVFEQPRPPRDGSDPQPAGNGRAVPGGAPGDDAAVTGASVRPAASRPRGVLDLYA